MEHLYCDPRKCIGCHACELACAVEHSQAKDLYAIILNSESAYPRRAVQLVGSESFRVDMGGRPISLGCHHCNPAPCVDACFSGAMHKKDGKTECTASQCLACWMCVMACPYGVITAVETALKCDLCPDRVGREGRARYACVDACPTGALIAGSFQEFQQVLEQPVEWLLPQQPSHPV